MSRVLQVYCVVFSFNLFYYEENWEFLATHRILYFCPWSILYIHYKNIRVTVCKNRVHMVQSVVVFAENLTKSKQSWPYDSLIDVNKRLWHPTTHQNPRGNDIFRLAFIQGKQAVRHQPWDMIEAIFIDGDNSVRRRWGQVKFRSIWTQINQDTGSFPCEFTDQCNEKRQAPSWLSLMELLGHFSSFPASNSADKNILTTFLLLPWFFFIAQLPVIINSLFFFKLPLHPAIKIYYLCCFWKYNG